MDKEKRPEKFDGGLHGYGGSAVDNHRESKEQIMYNQKRPDILDFIKYNTCLTRMKHPFKDTFEWCIFQFDSEKNLQPIAFGETVDEVIENTYKFIDSLSGETNDK